VTNREFFLHISADEHPRFVRTLEATPSADLDFRPHPRSRSAYELIGHLIGHEQDLLELAESGTVNHRMQVPFSGIADAVKIYSDAHRALGPALAAVSEDAWGSLGKFMVQGNVIMEAPRRDLAWMILLDAIHHRGQLSTYLRPMGGTVPSIYGPSGDTVLAKV
jgi:uncharacterized damage-inducible protein DinB